MTVTGSASRNLASRGERLRMRWDSGCVTRTAMYSASGRASTLATVAYAGMPRVSGLVTRKSSRTIASAHSASRSWPSTAITLCAGSGRLDVRVQAEQVARIVFLLDRAHARQVALVIVVDDRLRLVADLVGVVAVGEALERGPVVLDVADVRRGIVSQAPRDDREHVVPGSAVRERGRILGHAADRAAGLLEE